jgi:CubicO group peptidase (beta-lactamase class C family)
MRQRAAVLLALALACRSTARTDALDAAVPKLLAGAHVPGAAVAVIDGSDVQVRTYGVADVESKAPVTPNTVFEAASIGKVVFAYAVMRLAGRGQIELDRPLQSYLAAPYIADPRAARITARMVLAHRTGLPNWRAKDKELALIAEPNERYGYSGEGFLFLQKAVEAITGEPIETTMRREVFEPLQMTQSTYIWLPSYDEQKAWGHNAEGKRWRRRKPEGANVAATLQTTAGDLAKFVIALSRTGSMFVSQTDVLPAAPDIHWGLGVGLLRRGDDSFFWHWGDNGDFHGYIFGSGRHAVVILTNGANGLSIAENIARIAMGDEPAAQRPLAWLGYVKERSESL